MKKGKIKLNSSGSMMRFLCYFCMLLPLSGVAEIKVEEGYVRELLPRQRVTAAFMQLRNTSDEDVVINGAQSSLAERSEIHAHRHRNGMMSMERVDRIVVPAKGKFVLKPGGHHLMLLGLQRTLLKGELIDIELIAESGEIITVELPVRSVLNEKF
jgi:copper(I)-binding protein